EASQTFLLLPLAFLFTSHIRYMGRVEGRSFRRILPFSLALWSTTWIIEAVGVWSGIYHYERTVLGALRLGPVPLLIPCVWVLFCWLAASIVHFLWGRGAGKSADLPLPAESLATAWVLVSMAFAIEWHFSRLIGLWNWSEARGGWTINGVPAVNFLIWSVVGLISPVLQRIGRAPRIKYRSPSVFLQCLPVLGFGLVLAFNAGLNVVRSFPGAGALCASSVFVLGLALAVRFRRRAGSARRPYPNQEE
ncbi:MAG: carotenoid biosynthesis protein, partial [Candidatus Aminicenantales bacterium]